MKTSTKTAVSPTHRFHYVLRTEDGYRDNVDRGAALWWLLNEHKDEQRGLITLFILDEQPGDDYAPTPALAVSAPCPSGVFVGAKRGELFETYISWRGELLTDNPAIDVVAARVETLLRALSDDYSRAIMLSFFLDPKETITPWSQIDASIMEAADLATHPLEDVDTGHLQPEFRRLKLQPWPSTEAKYSAYLDWMLKLETRSERGNALRFIVAELSGLLTKLQGSFPESLLQMVLRRGGLGTISPFMTPGMGPDGGRFFDDDVFGHSPGGMFPSPPPSAAGE